MNVANTRLACGWLEDVGFGWKNEGLCHRYIGDPQVGFRSEKPCLRTCQCKYIYFFYIPTLGMAGTLPATVTIRILPS